jgi:serine/threonine protein kinase
VQERRANRALAEQAMAALQSCLAPTDDPKMIGRIGNYEVVGVIGRGATGVVVKAFQPSLNRFVAIKLLAPELAVNAAARVRFEREAQAAAAVVHEHVVPIYAVDEFRGTPFLVMQYVSGGSLEKRLSDEGILASAAALRIGMQIASGLAAAHAQGLIHRDIKPANILLESGLERVLITDFGLARAVDDATLTHSGFVAGTPQFMSPEQARGEGIDHRTDLFSLGSVLYALLAGRPPFHAETAYGLLKRICESPHRRLVDVNRTIPAWLSGIVDRLLSKEPEERFTDASEVAETLSACLAHLQNPAACELPKNVRRRAAYLRTRSRNRIAAAAVLCGLTGIGVAAWRGDWFAAKVGDAARTLAQSQANQGNVPVTPMPQVSTLRQIDDEISAVRQRIEQTENSWRGQGTPLRDLWQEIRNQAATSAEFLMLQSDRDQTQNVLPASEIPFVVPRESVDESVPKADDNR